MTRLGKIFKKYYYLNITPNFYINFDCILLRLIKLLVEKLNLVYQYFLKFHVVIRLRVTVINYMLVIQDVNSVRENLNILMTTLSRMLEIMSSPHFVADLTNTPELQQIQKYLADHFSVIRSNIKFVLDRKIHEPILVKILKNPTR